MKFRLGLLILGVFLLGTQAQAKVIRGTVTDAATGEPLPAATLQVLGVYDGTISNAQGIYVLELHSLPATVEVRYIGYRSQKIEVTEGANEVQDFELAPVPIEMEELVVTAQDMGPNIMRKVIAQKQTWWQNLETLRVEAYSRFIYKKEEEIVAIVESLSDGFWHREKGWREVVKDKRETKNWDMEFALPAAAGVNLYDDETELGGHYLVGVTHPKALDHYDFKLKGRRRIDDQIIYDIEVKAKHGLKTAFNGRVAVLDSVYALLEVELTPNRAFLFPPPIRQFAITMRQQFSNFGGDFWLPVGYQSAVTIEIGMIGLQFPPIKGQRVSRLTGYEINVPLPDSMYERRRRVVVDSARVEQDSLLAKTALSVPLSEIEQEAYVRIDSTMTLNKVFKPKGFLARFIDDDDDNGGGRRGRKGRGRGLPVDLKPEVWFNRVDGGHLGLKVESESSRSRFGISGGGAYNLGLKRWSFDGETTVSWGQRERGSVSFQGFRGTDTRYRSGLYNRFQASSQQLFGADDYFDYFWNEGFRGRLGYRFGNPRRAGVKLTAGVNIEQHTSVAKTTDWSVFNRADVQRVNPTIDSGDLRSVVFQVDIEGDNDGPAPLFGQSKISLEVEHCRIGFDSDFAFTQFQMVLDWRLKTLFHRRLLPNVLDVRIVGSTFTGTLPEQRYGILDAWLDGFSTFGAFRTRIDYPYEGEKKFGVFWEHHFRTVPFELVGWQWAAERGIGVIVHGGHGRTWFANETLAGLGYTPQYLDQFHHELGVSINGLFDLFRVNFTKRLDRAGFYVSVGMARIF